MASKQVIFDDDAQEALVRGVTIVKRAVGSTLGPLGRNVAIKNPWGIPTVVHDGVTVAKNLDPLDDQNEAIGAELIIEAAGKTNDTAGDGTTTAVILAHAIFTEARKNLAAGQNAMVLRRGINRAVEFVDRYLKGLAVEIKPGPATQQVATISAQHEVIGELISKAVEKLGRDAIITVEEAGTAYIDVEYKEGMEFDRGMISPYFITDPEHLEATINDPYILVTDKAITDQAEFLPFLKMWGEAPKERGGRLVIIAADVSSQPLATLVLNKIKQTAEILAIKAPGFGDKRKEVLEDIATLVGAQFISEESGRRLDKLTMEDLGHASRVTSTRDNTMIVGGQGDKALVDKRVAGIKTLLEKPGISEFDMEKLKERLAKLTSGVAIINVGAQTEAEMKELKERAIDAISATKAALEEGIVAGGETALLRASFKLEDLLKEADDNDKLGIGIVTRALELPFRQLMENAGYRDLGEHLTRIKTAAADKKATPNLGVDVMTGETKDLVKAGVIDPVKVPRTALKNAASTAVMLMTIGTSVTEKPEEGKPGEPGAY